MVRYTTTSVIFIRPFINIIAASDIPLPIFLTVMKDVVRRIHLNQLNYATPYPLLNSFHISKIEGQMFNAFASAIVP
jgi:hypothetical protein